MILAIYGAGAMGRETKSIADDAGTFEKILFIDDIQTGNLCNCPIVSFSDFKRSYAPDDVQFIIAMGEPRFRKEAYDKMKRAGFTGAVLIHPSAYVSSDAELGEGAVICQNAFIGSLVKAGPNLQVATSSNVGHDAVIGSHVRMGAGCFVGGHTVIGDCAFIGSVSMLKDRIKIGNSSVTAMGAAVFNDIPDNSTAVGNPARIVDVNRSDYLFAPSIEQSANEASVQADTVSIEEKYWNVFSECFADIDFNPVTFMFNDSGWDSIMQMTLITRLEEAFGISIKGRDILKINSYKTGLQMVTKKCEEAKG